jgi:subtilase family serine protease
MVASPTVSDDGPAAGAPFTLSATVRNAGDGASESTTLRYYRSTDAEISSSDAEVGTEAVAELAASATSSQSVSLTAPTTAGTHYYGVCVDAVEGESDTANNCSSSVQIRVPEPRPGPNLAVSSPLVSNSAPAVGTTFTVSATVRNAGDEASAVTTMRFYRSTDATITTSDTEVGTDTVGGLSPTGTSSQSATSSSQSGKLASTEDSGTYYYHGELELDAPSTPGTYYYGACVDAVTDESDTTNNCSSSAQVTVRSSEQQVQGTPDLNPYTIVVEAGLASLSPGGSFTLSVGVRNDGNGSSAATTLRYYRSTDATVTTSDT